MDGYKKEMLQCIKLAKLGEGQVSPNPLVGCVILNSSGQVVSSGYHEKYGDYHAERNALLKIDNARDCTLVVNLEPCCHYGKTPPCTDIIIEKGIKTVVYGMEDPNPKVSKKGLKILKDAGIEIIGPVLGNECRKLNEIFIKNQTKKLPFVAVKTATTIDGKIATSTGDSKWITSEKSRNYAKKLRKKYDAILTSSATVIADNPNMIHSKKIIIDRALKTNFDSNIYNQGEIYVFCSDKNRKLPKTKSNIHIIPAPEINSKIDIEFVLKKMYELGIMSIFVEAGGVLCGSFLPYADKIYQFVAPKILGDNSGKTCFDGELKSKISQCTNFKVEEIKKINPDILIIFSSM